MTTATADKAATATSPRQRMEQDDEFLIGCLLVIHGQQTQEEQAWKNTVERNDLGFNARDAEFGSSLAEQYRAKGYLSPRQLAALREMLPKYAGQLGGRTITPAPIKPMTRTVGGTTKTVTLPTHSKWVTLDGGKLSIRFPYDPVLVAQVKELAGRRWDQTAKLWTAPLAMDTFEKLKAWGFGFDAAVSAWYDEKTKPPMAAADVHVPGLRGELFPFQREGVAFLEARKGRALLAHEMGLGKTVITLAWLALHPELRPALIVCPASLKLNWEREAARWLPEAFTSKVDLLQGTRPWPPTGAIHIVNYDILTDWLTALSAKKYKVLVLDEAHYIKNRKAQRTQAVRVLSKGIPHVIALSGTPIVNRPVEFFEALHTVDPQVFPSFWKYAQRYCNAKASRWGWDFSGSSNAPELNEILTKTLMLRRLKADVLTELPAKRRCAVEFDLDNWVTYRAAEADFIGWLENVAPEKAKSAARAEALAQIEALKQLAAQGKLEAVIEWVTNFLDSGRKLVLFATHHATIDALAGAFKGRCVVVDGRTSMADRQSAVDRFQDGSVPLFIGNIKAAGVGITLTAASDVAFVELPWTPGDLEQAADRVHRIGQRESVTVWYLLAPGTIDEKVAALLDKKRGVLTAVLDGKTIEEGDENLLAELLAGYRKKEDATCK